MWHNSSSLSSQHRSSKSELIGRMKSSKPEIQKKQKNQARSSKEVRRKQTMVKCRVKTPCNQVAMMRGLKDVQGISVWRHPLGRSSLASPSQTFFCVGTLTLHHPHHTLTLLPFVFSKAMCLHPHLSQAPLVDHSKISPVSQGEMSAIGCCQTPSFKLCFVLQSPLQEHLLPFGSFFLSLRVQSQVLMRVICPGSGIQSSHSQVATSVDRLQREGRLMAGESWLRAPEAFKLISAARLMARKELRDH